VSTDLRLLCVLAHPDDESLGTGGILARYAAEGVTTAVVTATRGERGRIGTERPGAGIAGPIRERELRAAAAELGVSDLSLLGFLDGEVDRVEPHAAISRIAAEVRRLRPDVVVTFPGDGTYGHPDHIAVSQLTGAALVAAADPAFRGAAEIDLPATPHTTRKFYWMAWASAAIEAYERAIGARLRTTVDDAVRHAHAWPDWAITTVVDSRRYWRTTWRAVQCHQSQISNYGDLAALPESTHEELWGSSAYYRVWSLVNGGRSRESDLFEGLR